MFCAVFFAFNSLKNSKQIKINMPNYFAMILLNYIKAIKFNMFPGINYFCAIKIKIIELETKKLI